MSNEYTLMVAGFDYHQKELKSLLTEKNPDYQCSKKELLNDLGVDQDDRIYEYEIADCYLDIKHESGNKYDPAALQVFADGVFIGYVPQGNLDTLGRIASHPSLQMSVRIYGGRYKYLEYDEDEDFFGDMDDKYFKVRTEQSPYKAIMVFRWDS